MKIRTDSPPCIALGISESSPCQDEVTSEPMHLCPNRFDYTHVR